MDLPPLVGVWSTAQKLEKWDRAVRAGILRAGLPLPVTVNYHQWATRIQRALRRHIAHRRLGAHGREQHRHLVGSHQQRSQPAVTFLVPLGKPRPRSARAAMTATTQVLSAEGRAVARARLATSPNGPAVTAAPKSPTHAQMLSPRRPPPTLKLFSGSALRFAPAVEQRGMLRRLEWFLDEQSALSAPAERRAPVAPGPYAQPRWEPWAKSARHGLRSYPHVRAPHIAEVVPDYILRRRLDCLRRSLHERQATAPAVPSSHRASPRRRQPASAAQARGALL